LFFLGDELYEHWLEYENAETPEAKFVKDFDKFEMILTAHEYETGIMSNFTKKKTE
jgi:putative hydrolase of HD superfamily